MKKNILLFVLIMLLHFSGHSQQLPVNTLPPPWKNQDIGATGVKGSAVFINHQFIIEGSGVYTDSARDRLQYVYLPLENEAEISLRFVPQAGAQLCRMGLMMRESLAANAPTVALLLNDANQGRGKPAIWEVVQLARGSTGAALTPKNIVERLEEPVVNQGRIIGFYWLRLQRKYNSFFAFTSTDGKTWKSLRSSFVEMNKKFYAGIAVSSGSQKLAARVVFDSIRVPGWNSED